jgi:hypothetical protein
MINFFVNGKAVSVDADSAAPLLWVIRDHLGLPGTKFGWGGFMRRMHCAPEWKSRPIMSGSSA